MKVYISVDIEGIAGISHWDEALKSGPDHAEFRTLMTNEAIAACEAAIAAGASDIYLRDAHETARNLEIGRIPSGVRLIRGWSGHPYKMIQELDDSFDALVMVGWHGPAADGGNPLSHTMTGTYANITLNGVPLSEFGIHALLAATHRVPVVFLSGDAAVCAEARQTNPAITTVETKYGHGASIISLTPADSCERIRQDVARALKTDPAEQVLPRHDRYRLDLRFSHHEMAYRRAFYPGASLIAADTIRVESDTPFEIARALCFM
ncbi:MAG: M55 family metallopeptidase [Paracoccaceae bacterium]